MNHHIIIDLPFSLFSKHEVYRKCACQSNYSNSAHPIGECFCFEQNVNHVLCGLTESQLRFLPNHFLSYFFRLSQISKIFSAHSAPNQITKSHTNNQSE